MCIVTNILDLICTSCHAAARVPWTRTPPLCLEEGGGAGFYLDAVSMCGAVSYGTVVQHGAVGQRGMQNGPVVRTSGVAHEYGAVPGLFVCLFVCLCGLQRVRSLQT